MPLHSDNQRLELLGAVKAHIFWGMRSFQDFEKAHGKLGTSERVVIADKAFTNRFRTVFSINREWGGLGHFVSNQNAEPLEVGPYLEEPSGGYVLELGQDVLDFSYRADSDGYSDWLKQWPERLFRPHPKVQRSARSLADDLAGARLVVGLNTSALVEASLAGHKVEAYGAHSVVRGVDLGRANCLRTLRGYEWDRRDRGAAAAIQAALDAPRVEVPSPVEKSAEVDPMPLGEAQAATRHARGARKASRRKG